MCLKAPRSARGLKPCSVGGVTKVGHDGARFIEKADDITLAGVGGPGDFSQSPGAVKNETRMRPRWAAELEGSGNARYLFGEEGVGARKVTFLTRPR